MRLSDAASSRTDWSMICDAGASDESKSADAMDRLARRYWPAVFAFIRSTGRDPHESANLTQGFFCDVILGRGLVARADKERGRFRSYLLHALQNYLHEEHRRSERKKRKPEGRQVLSLNESDLGPASRSSAGTPEQAFNEQWTATLIRHVTTEVREAATQEGLTTHWEVFEARVLRPLMYGHQPEAYDSLAKRLSLRDQSQASNMMVTIKRRFVTALLEDILQTVMDPSEVEDELAQILQALEGS